jgi:hypothetical protein
MADVFISYSRKDIDFAQQLLTALGENGREGWIDLKSIEPTRKWWDEICSGIQKAQNFVFVISPDSIASPICNLELQYAFQNGKRIVPLYARETVAATAFGSLAAYPLPDFIKDLLAGREILVIARDNWNDLSALHRLDFTNPASFDDRF